MRTQEGDDRWPRGGGTALNRRAFLAATASASAGLLVGLPGMAAGESTRLLPEIRWRKQGLMLSPEGAPLWLFAAFRQGLRAALESRRVSDIRHRKAGGDRFSNRVDRSDEDLGILRENPANPVLASGRLCRPILTASACRWSYVSAIRCCTCITLDGSLSPGRTYSRTASA